MAKLILVGGGTASGKTYVINKVIESLGNEHITHISIDDYYKDLTDVSDKFKFEFYNSGVVVDGKIYTSKLKPVDNPIKSLRSIREKGCPCGGNFRELPSQRRRFSESGSGSNELQHYGRRKKTASYYDGGKLPSSWGQGEICGALYGSAGNDS